jgi:hypothetical protein
MSPQSQTNKQTNRYPTLDTALTEVYDIDPLAVHGILSLGAAVAQGRPFVAALYQNQMKAVELPADTLQRLLVSAAAHQAAPWLVFEPVLLNTTDNRSVALATTQGWRYAQQSSLSFLPSESAAPVACVASSATRSSQWNSPQTPIVPLACLRLASELGAPARVAYDRDYRPTAEWLAGVKLLVLDDSARCLPRSNTLKIVEFVASGGTLLAGPNSGICDGLGRSLPQQLTLLARLKRYGSGVMERVTVAELNSSVATNIVAAHSWVSISSDASRLSSLLSPLSPLASSPAVGRIAVPYARTGGVVTVFVLCASASSPSPCDASNNVTLRIPIDALEGTAVNSATLTSPRRRSEVLSYRAVGGNVVVVDVPAVAEDYAVVLTMKKRNNVRK